jgi:hypothetical protein
MALASRAKVVAETVQVFRLDDHHQRTMPDAVALRKAHKPTTEPELAPSAPAMHRSPLPHRATHQPALSMADGDWESH